MINASIVSYKTFGRCVVLNNGILEIYVTVDIGPRIIRCSMLGRQNLMFNDELHSFSNDVSSAFGAGKNWYIYGGHRMWVSPEDDPLSYYPDNEPVAYTLTPNGAVFTPKAQAVTGYQYEWEITLAEDKPEVKISHKLTNASDKPFKGAVWCLSVMDAEGVCIVPQPTEDTGLLSNRVLSVWPYTDMTDKRVIWGEKYIGVKQDKANSRKFKYGISNTAGKVAYLNHNQALVKSFSSCHPIGEYPDFGVSCEVFTNEHFLEAESLSPLYTVEVGGSVTHTETWTLYDNIEKPELTNESLEAAAAKLGL